MTKQLTEAQRRLLRASTRQYAAKFLRPQDTPEWPIRKGHFAETDYEAEGEFMDELERIANRIEKSITPAGRAALEASE